MNTVEMQIKVYPEWDERFEKLLKNRTDINCYFIEAGYSYNPRDHVNVVIISTLIPEYVFICRWFELDDMPNMRQWIYHKGKVVSDWGFTEDMFPKIPESIITQL